MKWLVRHSDYRVLHFLNQCLYFFFFCYLFSQRQHPVYIQWKMCHSRQFMIGMCRLCAVWHSIFFSGIVGGQWQWGQNALFGPADSIGNLVFNLGERVIGWALGANPHRKDKKKKKNATSEQFNRFPVFAFFSQRHRRSPKRKRLHSAFVLLKFRVRYIRCVCVCEQLMNVLRGQLHINKKYCRKCNAMDTAPEYLR